MMQDGLTLMAIGMTVVFAFLALLVAAMSLLGAYFGRFPAPAGAGSPAGARAAAGAPGTDALLAAAAAAAYDYDRRKDNGDEES